MSRRCTIRRRLSRLPAISDPPRQQRETQHLPHSRPLHPNHSLTRSGPHADIWLAETAALDLFDPDGAQKRKRDQLRQPTTSILAITMSSTHSQSPESGTSLITPDDGRDCLRIRIGMCIPHRRAGRVCDAARYLKQVHTSHGRDKCMRRGKIANAVLSPSQITRDRRDRANVPSLDGILAYHCFLHICSHQFHPAGAGPAAG